MHGENALRVMTLNIAHASERRTPFFQSEPNTRQTLERIAALVRRETPNVVAFQEIDRNSAWNGRFCHGSYIAQRADYPYLYTGSHQVGRYLDYGTALMSNLTLKAPESIPFNRPFARSRKGFVIGSVDYQGHHVDVVSLHLDFLRPAQRRKELGALIARLRERAHPIIVMGDFNTEDGGLFESLRRELNLHTFEPDSRHVTYPLFQKRFDWVLASPLFDFVRHEVLPDDPVSDHHPVVAELVIRH